MKGSTGAMPHEKTPGILTGLYLLFLAALTACGDAFFQGGDTGTAGIAAKAAVYLLLFALFFRVIDRFLAYTAVPQAAAPRWYAFFTYSRKNVLRLALLFFAVYAFYLLVFFPGVTSGDTMYQLEDLVTGMKPMPYPVNFSSGEVSALMSDHHPVATTLIFTLFYRLGLLFGDANLGLFLYNVLQCAALALLFAFVVCAMDHVGVPKPLALVSALFCASPVVASFAVFMGKDALFSFCFVLYLLVFAGLLLRDPGQGGEKRQWVWLAVLSVLLALMNKKGMYISAISGLCLMFAVPGRKKLSALAAAALPVLVVSVLLQRLLFPALDIVPGGRQEMLGTAFQQTALSLIEQPENYTQEEKDLYFSLFEFSSGELETVYSPTRTDEVKNHFLQTTGQEQVRAYLKMWAAHLPRELRTYIRATLSVSGGYLAPQKAFNVYQGVPYSEALGAFSQPERLSGPREALGSLFYWLENIPLLSVFCQDSFYVFWLPAYALYRFCRRRQGRRVVLLVPFAVNLLFLLIGPVCITRYALCQLYAFPVLLALVALPVQPAEAGSRSHDYSLSDGGSAPDPAEEPNHG